MLMDLVRDFWHFGLFGAIVLGAVMAYADFRNRKQNPRNVRIAEAATREEYRHPDSYNPETFRQGLKPNMDGTIPDGAPGGKKASV
jgi:hypothetical protein